MTQPQIWLGTSYESVIQKTKEEEENSGTFQQAAGFIIVGQYLEVLARTLNYPLAKDFYKLAVRLDKNQTEI